MLGSSPFCGSPGGGAGSSCCRYYTQQSVTGISFTVTNATNTSPNFTLSAQAAVRRDGAFGYSVIAATTTHYLGASSGLVTVGEIGQLYPPVLISGATGQTSAPILGVSASSTACSGLAYQLSRVLHTQGPCANVIASEAVFPSTVPLSISFLDGAVKTDTTTLALYELVGTAWSSAAITNQKITTSAATGLTTVYGEYTRTGQFGAFFSPADSSAPITTQSFVGISSKVFANVNLVSTDTYILLVATDPLVAGFASQVATTYYRLDAATTTAAYSTYVSSFPVSLGFHVLEYYSQDWAGNAETVHTSTFLVTAGTVFKDTLNARAGGYLLLGYLSYGNRADIQSAAQNAYTLLVSSADRSPLGLTTNIGQTVLGGWAPQATLESYSAQPSQPPLGLRSGNASTATPSVQIALGYNGDVAMSHIMRSEHSSSAAGERLDWLLWYPPTGSTTTLGNLAGLTLTTATFHVHPATGTTAAQVEVSDGGTIGAGTVHRAAAYAVSSRLIKTDISYLTDEDHKRAYQDVLALKHAKFRYKADLPDQQRKGLILEETPASIRGAGGRIVYDERLVNVELALKEASARLEKLRKRLKELEAGR